MRKPGVADGVWTTSATTLHGEESHLFASPRDALFCRIEARAGNVPVRVRD